MISKETRKKVMRLFLNNDNNTMINISKKVGISKHFVSKIVDEYYIDKMSEKLEVEYKQL